MKKLLIILLGVVGYGQPIKLRTITMRDSYKGSSVTYRSVTRATNNLSTGHINLDAPITNYDYHEPPKNKPRYKGEWKVYDLDKSETDCTAVPNTWRTSDVAIYHGDRQPVYLSEGGRLFIWVTSNGQTYRKYINK